MFADLLALYGVVYGVEDLAQFARRFLEAGWRASRTGDSDYQLEQPWTRFELLEDEGSAGEGTTADILLAGVIDEARFDDLVRLLGAFHVSFDLDLNDTDGNTMRQVNRLAVRPKHSQRRYGRSRG